MLLASTLFFFSCEEEDNNLTEKKGYIVGVDPVLLTIITKLVT